MKTIIINASPKGNSDKCNSYLISQAFIRKMEKPCDLRALAGSSLSTLAQEVLAYDAVIFVLPLYIHAMPSRMKAFMEVMKPADRPNLKMGFILQAGFIETEQHAYVEPYLKRHAEQLGYAYLGTVSKGEAAGLYMFPKMFKKMIEQFELLGKLYEKTNQFDPSIVEAFHKPYRLSAKQVLILQLINTLKINNIGWYCFLHRNKALHLRRDQPFLEMDK